MPSDSQKTGEEASAIRREEGSPNFQFQIAQSKMKILNLQFAIEPVHFVQ
jgi:hypothetical protein